MTKERYRNQNFCHSLCNTDLSLRCVLSSNHRLRNPFRLFPFLAFPNALIIFDSLFRSLSPPLVFHVVPLSYDCLFPLRRILPIVYTASSASLFRMAAAEGNSLSSGCLNALLRLTCGEAGSCGFLIAFRQRGTALRAILQGQTFS